jgi:hypothetical protein
MLLKGDNKGAMKELLGYPLVKKYKYLGVLINNKMNCPDHIHVNTGKLNKYFSRNKWLMHKYFSTGGLVQIWNLFQRSKLAYGMSTFADDKTRMKELKLVLLKHLKSILRLPKTTKTSRILVALGITKFKYTLQLQLARTIGKYGDWFGDVPQRNMELINKLKGKFDLGINYSDYFLYKEWSRKLNERYTWMKAKEVVAHEIPKNYSSKLRNMYKACDGRDSMVVKYFCNIGFFRYQYRVTCQHCSEPNSREHAVDECSHYEALREDARARLGRFFQEGELVSTMLSKIYFRAMMVNKKDYTFVVLAMKSIITELYRTQVKEVIEEEEKASVSS